MEALNESAAWIMGQCYQVCGNYGAAILLFTLLSKVILLPVSIWVQKNSIKMVKMQPEINLLKVEHFGDPDAIAEGQSKIFKREKYSPFATVIPTILQLAFLMAVIAAIKIGMQDPAIEMTFAGVDLGIVPSETGGLYILSPIAAGLSAWLMCTAQNASNVLQSEQGKLSKYGTLIFSVGLSLYLGWFVAVGVALYWVASNLLAIAQLYLLNWLLDPKKEVDYEALEKSKEALRSLESLGREKGKRRSAREAQREKSDYKRFFKVVNKHVVFYSESSGFYKYYRGIIEYLLKKTNLVIHYITSDPQDAVFQLAEREPRIRPYYIGEKRLITLMMKMDADVVVMTMPDLENFHIKRSYLRGDIDYVYIPHCMNSLNLTMRKGSVDHYDTVLCAGPHQREEIEKTEKAYGLPSKRLISCGYPLLDEMRADYAAMEIPQKPKKSILIAPSWQKDNIVDSCLEEILSGLQGRNLSVTVRPHPQHVRHCGDYMKALAKRYEDDPDIEIQTDFSSNETVFSADLLITDWSGIAYEYAFTTGKPVLFINTPMKVMNPEYQKIDTVPLNISLRDEIGKSLDPDRLDEIADTAAYLLREKEAYREKILRISQQHVYNPGTSAQVAGEYIVTSVQKQIQKRKEAK